MLTINTSPKPNNNKEGFQMAELIKPQTEFSAEEVLRTEIVVYQALIDILIAKQIISEAELVYSIGRLRFEQEKMK